MAIEYRWKVLALVLFMQALTIGAGIYCFGFFVVHWVNEFSSQRSELMVGYTALTLMSGLLAPVAGVWIDKYSRRLLVLLGITAYVAGMLLVSQATGPWMVVGVFACLLPIGMSLSGPLMSQSLVTNAFDKNRGTALGICALGTSVGGFSMPVLVTYLLELYHWRYVFMILATMIGVGILPAAFWVLKNIPKTVQQAADGHKSMSTGDLLKDANLYKLAVVFFIPSTLFVGVLQNIGLQATDMALSQQQAGAVVSMAAALMAVGKFLTGWLADRIRHATIYYVLVSLVGLSLYVTATADGFLQLAIGVAVLGASAGGVIPLVSTMAATRYGAANFGRAMGVLMSSSCLSGLAPLAAGLLRDSTGSYESAFLLFIPLVVPAMLACYGLSKIPEAADAVKAQAAAS